MAFASQKILTVAFVIVFFFHDIVCLNERPPNYSFVHQATTAPETSYYDYIVIGGGTAGIPLAATLSQKSNVLLLERGGSPYGNVNITNVGNYIELLSDTSPNSPSQRFVSEDGVVSNRPRVLGGGTAINAGFYTRTQPSYVREVGWDERLVNESFRWVERVVAFEPPMGRWQTAVRDGLLDAGVRPNNGFTYDHIPGTKFGGTIFDRNSRRHTAADLLQYANPRGLTVLLEASVQRILFRTNGRSKPVAYGVVFRDMSGTDHIAYLTSGQKNEIILTAGALGSPQLLMLSGIGPKNHLKSLQIDIVLDQPLVGQRMKDNPMNVVFVPLQYTAEISAIEVVGITRFGSYVEASSGLNLVGGSPSDYSPYSFQRGGFIVEKISGPDSTGYLRLRNRDPRDTPAVRFNYFTDPRDLQKCVDGITTILDVINSRPMLRIRDTSLSVQDLLNITANLPQSLPVTNETSRSLEQFCRDTVRTIWHYHGGCQVGSVVDRDYKVIGVNALRVVDGSTFLNSPGTNPQATVMMLGRYMGVKIHRERFTKYMGVKVLRERHTKGYNGSRK